MRREIWLYKARSYDETEEFEKTYYSRMTPEERLDIVQYLRESYGKIQPLVGEISWTRHLVIMGRCKDLLEREFYIRMIDPIKNAYLH